MIKTGKKNFYIILFLLAFSFILTMLTSLCPNVYLGNVDKSLLSDGDTLLGRGFPLGFILDRRYFPEYNIGFEDMFSVAFFLFDFAFILMVIFILFGMIKLFMWLISI